MSVGPKLVGLHTRFGVGRARSGVLRSHHNYGWSVLILRRGKLGAPQPAPQLPAPAQMGPWGTLGVGWGDREGRGGGPLAPAQQGLQGAQQGSFQCTQPSPPTSILPRQQAEWAECRLAELFMKLKI